jgi:hypothetical protein
VQAQTVSPSDYYAFIQAHPQLGLEFPRTAEEKARLMPAVLGWKRQEEAENRQQVAQLAAGGLIAGGLGLAGYGLWRNRPRDSGKIVVGDGTGGISIGATDATVRDNWVADGPTQRRPGAPPAPLRQGRLENIDRSGSDTMRGGFGAYNNTKEGNPFVHPVIGPMLAAGRYDEARAAAQTAFSTDEKALVATLERIDRISGIDDGVIDMGSGRVETDKNKNLILVVTNEQGERETFNAGKLRENTIVKVNQDGVDRYFSTGSGTEATRRFTPLTASDVANRIRTQAEDANRRIDRTVDTGDIPGVGRYKAGTNIEPAYLGEGDNARSPNEPLGPSTEPVLALQGSDPYRTGADVEAMGLPAPKTVRPANQRVDLGTGSNIYSTPRPVVGERNPVTQSPTEMRQKLVRTVADLKDLKADDGSNIRDTHYIEIIGDGDKNAPAVEIVRFDRNTNQQVRVQVPQGSRGSSFVPLSQMPDDALLPPNSEIYKPADVLRRQAGATNPKLPPEARPKPVARVTGNGRLELFYQDTPYPQATRDKYAANVQAGSFDYNAGKQRYNLFKPETIERSVLPAIGGRRLSFAKQTPWREGEGIEAAKVNKQKFFDAVDITAKAVRARELADPNYKGPGLRGLHALAHAALSIVTPKGQDVPLDRLRSVISAAHAKVRKGEHQQGNNPTPLKLTANDLLLEPISRPLGPNGEPLLGPADPAQPRRPATAFTQVTLSDTPSGMHFELGASPQVKAAAVVTQLLGAKGRIPDDQLWGQIDTALQEFGVSRNQVLGALQNMGASRERSALMAAVTPEARKASLAPSPRAVGGKSATDFDARLAEYDELLQRQVDDDDFRIGDAMDTDEQRKVPSGWKDLWLEQSLSGMEAAPRLTAAAQQIAAVSGRPADAAAIASSWTPMVRSLVDNLSDELGDLDFYDRVGIVGEAVTRAAHDYPKAIEFAAASKDPAMRQLAARAKTAGVAGHFEFEHFARQYVGNAAAMLGIAARTDGTNPAPLRLGEKAGVALLAEARARKMDIQQLVNVKLQGATTPTAAVIRLRNLTKGAGGGLPNLMDFGGVRDEPYTNGAALADAFMSAPEEAVRGSAVGELRFGEGKTLGFDRPAPAPFAIDNRTAGNARFPFRLLFSGSQAEGDGFNRDSLLEGQLDGLGKPVTKKHGNKSKTPGAITTEATTFNVDTKNLDLQIDELGKRRKQVLDGDELAERMDRRIANLTAIRQKAIDNPNYISTALGLLNTDANRAQGLPMDGTGGLVIDFDPRAGVPVAQRMEAFTGRASSLEQLQEMAGDRLTAAGTMVGVDRQNEQLRDNALEPGGVDVEGLANSNVSDGTARRLAALEQDIEVLNKVVPQLQSVDPQGEDTLKKAQSLALKQEQLAQAKQVLATARASGSGQLPATAVPVENMRPVKPLAEVLDGLEGGEVLFTDPANRPTPPPDAIDTGGVVWVPPEQVQASQTRNRINRKKSSADWQLRIAEEQERRAAVRGAAKPYAPADASRADAAAAPIKAPTVGLSERKVQRTPQAPVAPVPSPQQRSSADMAITREQERRLSAFEHKLQYNLKVQLGDPDQQVGAYAAPKSDALLDAITTARKKRSGVVIASDIASREQVLAPPSNHVVADRAPIPLALFSRRPELAVAARSRRPI